MMLMQSTPITMYSINFQSRSMGDAFSQTRPYETPELCKVPDLQCIMAAADVRLSDSRGCSTLRPCCIASGTQAPQPVTL
jgi:hypothetical protein